MHWLAHVLGLDNPSGHWYLFWSGFGGCLRDIGWMFGGMGLVHWHYSRHHK